MRGIGADTRVARVVAARRGAVMESPRILAGIRVALEGWDPLGFYTWRSKVSW